MVVAYSTTWIIMSRIRGSLGLRKDSSNLSRFKTGVSAILRNPRALTTSCTPSLAWIGRAGSRYSGDIATFGRYASFLLTDGQVFTFHLSLTSA